MKRILFTLCVVPLIGCSSSGATVTCGPGTVLQDGTCVLGDGGTDSTLGDADVGADAHDAADSPAPDAAAETLADASDATGGVDAADAQDGAPDSPPVMLPWTRHFGGTGDDHPLGVLANAAGETIVHGFSQSPTIDLGNGAVTLPGGTPGFLVKLDPAGKTLWTKVYSAEGGGEIDAATQAIDASGNIFVGGGLYHTTGVDFGDAKMTAPCGGSGSSGCAYVAKIDPSGKFSWGKFFAASVAYLDGMVCDGTNVVLAGHFSGSIDFGLGLLSGVGSDNEIFLAKLGLDGTTTWAKRFNGGSAGSSSNGVATDADGNVLVTGWFNGSIDFGGGPLVSAGGTDIFLAKFDKTGAHLWSQRFGDPAVEQGGMDVKADQAGNVVVEGYLTGSANFGGGSLSAVGSGTRNLFVAKFTPSGTHVWSKVFGGSGGATGAILAVDTMGGVLLTGAFGDSIDFGGGPLAGSTLAKGDMFLAKLTSAGAHVWSHHFGGPTSKWAVGVGVASDPTRSAVVLAAFEGATDFDDGLFPGANYGPFGGPCSSGLVCEDIFLGRFSL